MAVQSLAKSSSPSFDASRDKMVRGRMKMDQEKLLQHEKGAPSGPTRSHNVSPSQKTALPRWRHKGKEKSSVELACSWIVEHQISIAVRILSVLFLTHLLFPLARHHTQKFFSISYYNPQTNRYAVGWDDICFVFFWIIVFTGARCATMDYLLTPLAAWAGINKKKEIVRFAEQAWILLYYGFFWSCGMYIMANSPYWLSLKALWTNYPTREMDGLAKWYYLVQFAFWLQQIVVVHIEERRKDHWQMFTHHIITCSLIFTSYGYHHSSVGNVVLCLMDFVDIILPLAKIFKYLKWNTICDITFGVFMVAWFITRHVLYAVVCWSVYTGIPRYINYGCYRGTDTKLEGPLPIPNDWDHLIQPFYDPEGLVCVNDNIRTCFVSMLLALQVVLIMWFVMIMRVAYKVIKGSSADDTRSDDEDEDEDDEEDEEVGKEKGRFEADHSIHHSIDKVPEPAEKSAFIEEEVDADALTPKSTSRSKGKGKGRSTPPTTTRRTRSSNNQNDLNAGNGNGNAHAHHGAATTSVSLRPGDRKDLLGRIGCDKGS